MHATSGVIPVGEEAMGPKGLPVLLFDLDGICANLAKKWLEVYNRDWGDHLTTDDISAWEWHRFVKPECGKRIYHYLNRPGFFSDLEPIPGCVEVLRRLAHRTELVVVTASPKEAAEAKIAWVRRHLPFVSRHNIVITYRKDLVRGDFMFDDAPRNLRHFQGIRLLLDYPYNREFHECYRVKDWEHFGQLMAYFLQEMAQGRRPPDVPQTQLAF